MKKVLCLLVAVCMLLLCGCAIDPSTAAKTVKSVVDTAKNVGEKAEKVMDTFGDTVEQKADDIASKADELASKADSFASRAEDALTPTVSDDPYTSETFTVNGESIQELSVEWITGSVTVQTHTGTDILFYETCSKTPNERAKLVYRIDGDELEIDCAEKSVKLLPDKQLVVMLPETLALRELKIENVSSGCTVTGVSVSELEVDSVSGDIRLKEVSAGKLKAETVSGDVAISLAAADSVTLGSVSGNVSLSAGDTGFTVDFSSVSGVFTCLRNVQVSGKRYTCGDGALKIDFSSVSGNLTVQ